MASRKDEMAAELHRLSEKITRVLQEHREEMGFSAVKLSLDIYCGGGRARCELHMAVKETPALIQRIEKRLAEKYGDN